MANDRTNSGDPLAELPARAGELRAPRPQLEPTTLAGRLVPVVDRIRQLSATLGVSIYRVFMVHIYWTGRKRGEGDPVVISRREIEPMPRVRDMSSVRRVPQPTGLTEEGDIIIDRISARYTEDDLIGNTPDLLNPVVPRAKLRSVEFFYEVQENRNSGPRPVPARFSPPVTKPMLSRGGLEWRITLTRAGVDSSRRGNMDNPAAE